MQTTSVWALVAYFGALSLLGPGWHCAFGAHFHCAFGHHFHSACEHSSAACDHAHCHAPAPASDSSPANDATDDGHYFAGFNSAHDCPLCQFFGIAQWSGCFPPIELAQLSASFHTPAPESPRLTFVSRYQSRGPPLAASCI